MAKDQVNITSLLSHQVKSPVRYIQYVTDYMLTQWKSTSDQDKLESIEIINQSARDIAQLLEDIIQWSKLNQGILKVKPIHFNILDLLKTEMGVHAAMLKIKELEVEIDLPDALVKTDPTLIRLVAHNIITNAIKFSNRKSKIYIKGKVEGEEFTLIIEDEGKGLDEAEIEKLLADEMESSMGTFDEQGTGVGNMLTKSIVKLLGGTLSIKSKIDAGTQVIVKIPVSS